MISLTQYITESLVSLKPGETGIIVFDIDDTLIRADSSEIGVTKHINGDKNNTVRLDTDAYAKDPDVVKHKEWFSYEEFSNPVKVVQSIMRGTPILKNLHILDAYIKAGYDFTFLTARGCEDAVKYAIKTILKVRDDEGNLEPIGTRFNQKVAAAINDNIKKYPGKTDAERKANVLRDICDKYNHVVFVDDDKKNVVMARNLGLKNLIVIKPAK